ncbi:MAG: hypothetical protein PHW63_06700 [Alphaproteobacteria bacterium]|nr:hypothetical protein [Alphaproteobacteria bacterium]
MKKIDYASYARVFRPRMISKAMQAFDKATIVIVSACWGGAIFLMILALYTVNLSVDSKRQVAEAAAAEPSLPKIVTRPPDARDMKPIVERLQKRFSDIGFTLANDQTLTVYTSDGSKFRAWLTVLSYIDTISPQFRWQIKTFCVGGECPGAVPMKAVLAAQKITFSAPEASEE